MIHPKVCLCLTCETIEEDLKMIEKYRNWIDMVELRVDYLSPDERLHIRKFPSLAGLPAILTIRRQVDGGNFIEGEATRTILFSRALAFAYQDISKNFAYIDLEEDFHVPGLQDAAFAFGTRIIRSYHNMKDPIQDIAKKMDSMRTTGYEIPKIACMPHSLRDVTSMFEQSKLIDYEHILLAMGPFGVPSRILAQRLGSFLSYSSPSETRGNLCVLNHLDPRTLVETYNFRLIDDDTKIFGVTGSPLIATSSPLIHNAGYRAHGMNAVYIPVRSDTPEEAIEFANQLNIKGLSVTFPHKQAIIKELKQISEKTGAIGACNTVVRREDGWYGYNTDSYGLKKALMEFTGLQNFKHKKVAIIGAGGAARAAANVVKELNGKCCIFNRTVSKARYIAELYRFKYAALSPDSVDMLDLYSDIIIQTTSVGMVNTEKKQNLIDPIFFYDFNGHEFVYDIVYEPKKTPLLRRAEAAGCHIQNGYSMLKNQGYEQFSLFTGESYE
ncbi:MAG: 3-dehydroquinate dehydratase [Treponema sp. CETP13]|nr:MAG: 3-dehydroquinate dehydratase [Treponema sp. CETP13]